MFNKNFYPTPATLIQKMWLKVDRTLLESTHFLIRFYKKGTMHLTFKDEGTLRRFNITACKEKNWLPQDYGRKKYADMTSTEKEIVESFEGKESYNTNLNKIGFTKETLMIEETA